MKCLCKQIRNVLLKSLLDRSFGDYIGIGNQHRLTKHNKYCSQGSKVLNLKILTRNVNKQLTKHKSNHIFQV